ncbi:hypothetical protein CHS0354_008522 [Potamilus streckersoni]|uniref:Uncharacterized protein n=1 Tax=Potamilus streckersoni TaxID=2493646 RepID=A0AAE0S7S2_9BIVA|nr:hypothetical protein CHS0354_008522 [Potamilus streckersoni]
MDLSKGQSNTKIELHVEHMDNVVETGCGYQVSRNSPAMDRSGPFSLKLNSVVWKSTTNLSDNADSLRYILSGEKNRQGSSNFGNRQDVLKSKAITSNVDQCPFSFESVIYSTQKKAEHSPSHIESDYKHIKAKHTTRSLSADRFRESSESPPPRSNGCPVTAVRALREKLNNRRPKSIIQLKTSSTTTSEVGTSLNI